MEFGVRDMSVTFREGTSTEKRPLLRSSDLPANKDKDPRW